LLLPVNRRDHQRCGTIVFLLGLDNFCPWGFVFQGLAQFSNALSLENFALSFPAKPGFVTISLRHGSLPREPDASVSGGS
jgi:hypothetical protein